MTLPEPKVLKNLNAVSTAKRMANMVSVILLSDEMDHPVSGTSCRVRKARGNTEGEGG